MDKLPSGAKATKATADQGCHQPVRLFRRMDNPDLEIGSLLLCPHCRRWHPVVAKHAEGTEYTIRMVHWDCRDASFYAGQIGGPSR